MREALAGTTTRVLVVLVKAYRLCLSPLLPPRCRHLPTCSEYMIEALEQHGPVAGAGYGIRRILRCHPWGTSGHDPVPPGSDPPGSNL